MVVVVVVLVVVDVLVTGGAVVGAGGGCVVVAASELEQEATSTRRAMKGVRRRSTARDATDIPTHASRCPEALGEVVSLEPFAIKGSSLE